MDRIILIVAAVLAALRHWLRCLTTTRRATAPILQGAARPPKISAAVTKRMLDGSLKKPEFPTKSGRIAKSSTNRAKLRAPLRLHPQRGGGRSQSERRFDECTYLKCRSGASDRTATTSGSIATR